MAEDAKPFDLDRPPAEFTPMAEPPPAEPAKPIYNARDSASMREAAEEVAKAREGAKVTPPGLDEEIDAVRRNYIKRDGSETPPNETITARRGANDLAAVRQSEQAASLPDHAATIDAVRAHHANPEAAQAEAQAQAQAQQQAQPATEQQAQSPSEFNDAARAAMAQQQQPIDGMHPDVAAALQNEHVRAALTREVESVEQARQQYNQAAHQAAQVAAAGFLSSFPELIGIDATHLGSAIAVIAVRDPQRAASIREHLSRTESLMSASRQILQHQEKAQAQRFAEFTDVEDQKFETGIANEPPEMVRRVKDNVAEVLQTEYGINKDELRQLWETQPLMRTAPVQRLLYDITRFKLATRDINQKLSRDTPPVQRPGTASAHFNDSALESAMRKFRSQPTAKNAAEMLQARRAAKR